MNVVAGSGWNLVWWEIATAFLFVCDYHDLLGYLDLLVSGVDPPPIRRAIEGSCPKAVHHDVYLMTVTY